MVLIGFTHNANCRWNGRPAGICDEKTQFAGVCLAEGKRGGEDQEQESRKHVYLYILKRFAVFRVFGDLGATKL